MREVSEMVKKPAEVIEENEEEGSGRKPDFLIRVRQPSYRGQDGKMYKSERFTTVGAAWKQTDKNGKEFYGCKLNVPNLSFADNSFILYPPYEDDSR